MAVVLVLPLVFLMAHLEVTVALVVGVELRVEGEPLVLVEAVIPLLHLQVKETTEEAQAN
jgi:hypothetical protein